MASLWYCCKCNFGPHNASLHAACIQCGVARCTRCIEEKVSLNMNTHTHSHSCDATSAYPAVVPFSSPRTPDFHPTTPSIVVPELSSLKALPRADFTGVSSTSLTGSLTGIRTHGQSYMYICCSCGDGPKIWDVQPKCVQCQHEACSFCTHIK